MANFIYDPKQKKSVNLDNVDSIEKSEVNSKYQLAFYKISPHKDSSISTSIAKWIFNSEKECDVAYDQILKEFGTRIGYENNPLAV